MINEHWNSKILELETELKYYRERTQQLVEEKENWASGTLKEVLNALGWEGGTIHQALNEIRRLKNEEMQMHNSTDW